MNPYIPSGGIYPKVYKTEPSFWIQAQYRELMNKGPYKLIRPVFIFNQPVWHKTQYNLDPNKRMKYGDAMVPVLTGIKTKDTKLYMQGFIAFIRERQWVCINRMEQEYYEGWMEREEYQSFSLSEKRYKALRLKANFHRRITLAYIISQGLVLTRENWENAWKHVYSRNITEYIQLIEAAIVLPKEWCDDEYIGT